MPEPETGTIEPDRLPETAPPASDVAAAPFLTPGGGETVIGQRWSRFTLEAEFPGARHTFLAEDTGKMEKVLISARRVAEGIEWRRRAWAQLSALEQLKMLRCREAFEERGWRYEVTSAPSSMTLREWIAAHRPGFDEIEALVRQMTATLSALHNEGLVHLNVRPESIHIDEAPDGPEFVLGGLQEVTLFNQPELISVEVDPFYAPPEAAGLARHAPGPRLRAWDWWSLGRLMQQFVLGQHVLGVILRRDVSVVTPELRTRAEMLLLEREPPGTHAGGIEHTEVDAAVLPLLRGLLTGSCEGRWGAEEVQRWLRRETVRDYYDLPRTTRLWTLDGRVFTTKDAAEHFTQAANWAAGEGMLLRPDESGTLAHFLKETPEYREDWDRLHAACELAATPAWAEIPESARRTLTVAIAWLALASTGRGPAVFRVRGQSMDTPGLLELLKTPGGDESVALFRGLLHPPVIEYVETLDGTAGRVLKNVATRANGALKLLLEHRWIDPGDSAAFTRLFTLALNRATALQERVARLQSTYATSRYPELAQMLANRNQSPIDYIVLAFTGETPEQCGFVTHAEWRSERYHALKSESDAIARTLRWVRLDQLFGYARLWGLPWPWFAGIAGALTAVAAVVGRSWVPAAMIASSLALSRAWLWWRVNFVVRRYDPPGARWNWRDGAERAATEARQAIEPMQAEPAALAQQMQTFRVPMAEFPAESRQHPPAPDPHWWDVAGGFAASALLCLIALLQSFANPRFQFATDETAATAAASPVARALPRIRVETADRSLSSAVVSDAAELLATGQYEIVDDGFGRRLRGPLRRWDRFSPPAVPRLRIQARRPASAEQAAFAVVSGSFYLRPYLRETTRILLAVRVPTTRGTGLLVFNARDRRLFDREVLLVGGPLEEDAWYELDGRRVLYIRNPLPLDATISLAPP